MFKWSSYVALPLDEFDFNWREDAQELLFQDRMFWENGGDISIELGDIPDTSNQDTRHELLTREQEQALANKLANAFCQLQALMAADEECLEKLMAQVLEQELDFDPRDLNGLLTLYDTLLVYGFLKERDPRFKSEFQLVWKRIQKTFENIILDRDFILSLAHQSSICEYSLGRLYALRNQFVTSNIRLVYHVARRHMDKGMSLDDMVQEGILGLI